MVNTTKKQLTSEVSPCIYFIRCLVNDRIYVGSTWRQYGRFFDHWKRLRGGYHKNERLQEDFNKYGVSGFQYETIRNFPASYITCEQLYECEQTYIDNFSPYYNIQTKVCGQGWVITDSIRAKIRKHTSETWIVTNPKGDEIEVFNLLAFCRENGLSRSAMGNVAAGKSSQAKGWKCRRKGVSVQPFIPKRGHRYRIFKPDGLTEDIKNLNAYCREHNLSCREMHQVSLGYQHVHRGHRCIKLPT